MLERLGDACPHVKGAVLGRYMILARHCSGDGPQAPPSFRASDIAVQSPELSERVRSSVPSISVVHSSDHSSSSRSHRPALTSGEMVTDMYSARWSRESEWNEMGNQIVPARSPPDVNEGMV